MTAPPSLPHLAVLIQLRVDNLGHNSCQLLHDCQPTERHIQRTVAALVEEQQLATTVLGCSSLEDTCEIPDDLLKQQHTGQEELREMVCVVRYCL